MSKAIHIVDRLLEADADPKKELMRLTTFMCPECGSLNTTQLDDEGLSDCLNCAIWFDPYHPNNRAALQGIKPELRESEQEIDAKRILRQLKHPDSECGQKCQICKDNTCTLVHSHGRFATGTPGLHHVCRECDVAHFNSMIESSPEESSDPAFDPIAYLKALPDAERRIRISYGRVTPESSEQGDFSEHGWIDEEGVLIEGNDDPIEVEAADFLTRNGATQPSSSHFHPGVWYSTSFEVIDYRTGEEEERSYHLHGFTDWEQQEIWNLMHNRRWNLR